MELHGKSIAFLGDSITEGIGVANLDNRYDNRLKMLLGLRATHNYGVSGSRLAHQRVPSDNPRYDLCFCGRAYDIDPNSDVIVVFGGVNDWIHGDAPFGLKTDTTPGTFCGAVNFLMKFLPERYPNARIVFVTPAHACPDGVSDSQAFPRLTLNESARTLVEYVRTIEALGKLYDIPVLNLYEKLGIDSNNKEQCRKYTVDGLHFDDLGHAVLADCLAAFLRAI